MMLAIIPVNLPLPKENPPSDDEDDAMPRQSMSHEAMVKLNEMRVNNQLCDASIEMDDGKIFNVHRAIMCACSEYFKTLFTTKLNENDPRNKTFLVGVKSSIMELFVRFAYLRDVNSVTAENVLELLIVSDYFGAFGLMKYCISYAIKSLSTENCVMVWLLSRYREIIRLKDGARFYILENFVNVALENQDFIQLSIDDFHSIVSDEMLNVKDEKVVWECIVRWIEVSPDKRKVYLTKLMRAVRLGLLTQPYFREKVQRNSIVENDPEARPIIIETLKFMNDLDTLSDGSSDFSTPLLAVPRLPHEVIFAIGGWSDGAPQTVIESYDTRADRWVRVRNDDPCGPRSYHGTAVIGTKLYCIGGFNGTEYFNTCRRFDAEKKTWKEVAPMHTRRCYVSVTALNGLIYALGGYDGSVRHNTGECYCPKTNQWTMIAPMHMARSDANACSMDGKIYITGGFNGQECMNSAESYDPETNNWEILPHMLTRRSGVSCVSHRGFIYAIGGFNGLSRMKSGERFDPTKNIWTNIKEMSNQRSNFGLEIIDDMLLAIGGFNGSVTIAHCECYVPDTNEWLEATDMTVYRSALTANVIKNLPNIRDYIHQERDKLAEDRRMRMYGIESSELMGVRFNNNDSDLLFESEIEEFHMSDGDDSE